MPNETQNESLPWGPEKKIKWFSEQRVQRSYHEDVLLPIEVLRKSGGPALIFEQYGALTVNPGRYPLHAIRVGHRPGLRNVLITGGVHGYETSGVKGALLFLEKHASNYTEHFNFIVAPCISPWSYETINRLDPVMENPNREFRIEGKAEESRLLMNYLARLSIEFDAHIDLHETTDSDLVFLPEEYSKNGLRLDANDIHTPDGFYLIGIEGFARPDLERAMIDAVRKVTHIAKPDEHGTILDVPLSQQGVIHKAIRGLCAEFTTAKSRLGAYTTEMYPDSEHFKALGRDWTEAVCSEVQVACIRGGLDFWIGARQAP